MRGLLLLVLMAALPTAGGAAEPPPALIETAEEDAQLCGALGGTATFLDGFQTARDLNGDGRADFVTDLAKLECAGAWDAFCGASGCPVTAWLSEPDGGYVRFDLGRLIGFAIREGAPLPGLVARYAAARCGDGRAGACSRTWTFGSNAPATPPLDDAPAAVEAEPEVATAPMAEAAAPAEAPEPGWTLREVPGSSPVALGGGVGNIASLAAFCLEGRPFLAVRFQTPPEAETVTLGFAFSQGAVEARAGHEATAGGAFVAALATGPLARRLAGRDSEVEVSVGGAPEGVLSLAGSTRTVRAALGGCYRF